MTNKQAIDLIHACMHINNAEILEARDKACIALEKQEPRKVKVINYEEYVGIPYDYYCPTCHRIIDIKDYCGTCGQALDWSDVND